MGAVLNHRRWGPYAAMSLFDIWNHMANDCGAHDTHEEHGPSNDGQAGSKGSSLALHY
jgi:hypothetical protein